MKDAETGSNSNHAFLAALSGPLCLTNEHDPARGFKVSTLIERLAMLPDWAKQDAYLTIDRRALDTRALSLCLSAETPLRRHSFLCVEILSREQSHALLSAFPSYEDRAPLGVQESPLRRPG